MQKLLQTFSKNFYLLVVWLFVFIPLYPKFPLFNVPGTYVAIRLEDILIALSLGLGLYVYRDRLNSILSHSVTQAIILFWAIGAVSLYSGVFLTQTVTPHLGFLHFLRRVEAMALFFLAWQAFSNIRQINLWMKAMFITTILIVLYGFGQQWLSFPVISTTNKEFSKGLILFLTPDARVNSTFAGHYDLAIYLAVFLCICAALLIYYRKIKTKIIIAAVSLLALVSLAMTAARVSFLAAIVGITIILWLANKKRLILSLAVLMVLIFVISPELRHRTVATLTVNLLEGGGPKYTPPPQALNSTKHFSIENAASGSATPSGVPVDIAPGEPLNTTELGVYRSYGIRLNEEWPRAIRAFFKNPFLGTGYSSISIASDNDYLRVLGETGVLGFLSLSLIWWILIKRFWNFVINKSKDLSYYLVLGIFTAVIVVFINATVIDVLESSKVAELLWLLVGIALALTEIDGFRMVNLGKKK